MNEKMREFVKGMLPGLPGKPHPMANKEPVAYLYNGVRLPKLPEWDREMYPYAMIRYYNDKDAYFLHTVKYRPYYTLAYREPRISYGDSNAHYKLIEDTWELIEKDEQRSSIDPVLTPIVWANFDIIDDSGAIYQKTGTTNDPHVRTAADHMHPCLDKSVKYLYNGVELPALPDFDIRVYPHVYICEYGITDSIKYSWYACRNPMRDTGFDSYGSQVEMDIPFIWSDETDWEIADNGNSVFDHSNYPIWANCDFLKKDGTLYLAASDPIPVYE